MDKQKKIEIVAEKILGRKIGEKNFKLENVDKLELVKKSQIGKLVKKF